MTPTRITKRKVNKKKQAESEQNAVSAKEGKCRAGICGNEAACSDLPNNQYICRCPHDSSPPTEDLLCPYRRLVPITPQPIHNIILQGHGSSNSSNIHPTQQPNGTESPKSLESNSTISQPASGGLSRTPELSLLIGVVLLLGILLGSVFLWWKRQCLGHCTKATGKRSKEEVVRDIRKDALLPERYTPNPTYSACASQALPLLRRDALVFLQEIGEGCFGKVYKGELRKDVESNVEIVAIKVLKDTASKEAEEDFMREVDIMCAFRHTNILTLVGVVMRENGCSPWMVFEYMPFGDLAEVLRANSRQFRKVIPGLPNLDKQSLLSVAQQVAAGMSYLATQRFVHRDLACRNCLVGTGLTVKIADFGMSRDVYTCDYYKIGGNRLLPIRWMSPESVMYGRFTLESDVWSFGVLLWEIYSVGLQPYYGHSNEEVLKLILQGIMLIPPDDCPGFICDLMRSCWKTEPRDRINFIDICERLQKAYDNKEFNKINNNTGTLPMPPKLPPMLTVDGSFQANHLNDVFKDDDFLQGNHSKPALPVLPPPSFDNVQHLPRPPANSFLVKEVLDVDGYMMPQNIKPVEYMIPIAD